MSYDLIQFNSVLTPSTQRFHQIPQVKGSVLGDGPIPPDVNRRSTLSLCFWGTDRKEVSTAPFLLLLISHSVMPDSFWPHELQHARLPCPSPSLGACSNSCPLSQWCHPTISSSVVPFFSCLQSFPASFLGSINFLEQLTELRETFYLLDHWFFIKGCNLGTVRLKRCREQAWEAVSCYVNEGSKSHLINIRRDAFVILNTGNPRACGSWMAKYIYIYIYL